jgi:hypothetical protein
MNSWLSPLLEKYGSPKQVQISRSNQPEARVIVKCVKRNQRFSVVVRKDTNGSWHRIGCEQIDPADVLKAANRDVTEGDLDMSWALNGLPCYLCGCAGKFLKGDKERTVYVRCGKCCEWVCLAWSVGTFFNCSNGCGAIGKISAETAPVWGTPGAAKVSEVFQPRPGLSRPKVLSLGNGKRLLR